MSEILSFSVSPEGTILGDQVYLMDTPVKMGLGHIVFRSAPLRVERYASSGKLSYTLLLRPGNFYRLGPNYGHRVRPAAEETDPILRVLRSLDIPVSRLVKMTEGQPLQLSRTDCTFVADGHEEYPENNVCIVSGATYCIVMHEFVAMNGMTYRDVGNIYAWPGCDPETLRAVLESRRGLLLVR